MELKPMYAPQKDSPTTFLSGNLLPSDTLITVSNAAILPQIVPYPLTIGVDRVNTETVMVTGIDLPLNRLTVVRGDSPLAWEANAKVARVFTADDLESVQDNVKMVADNVEDVTELVGLLDTQIESLEDVVGDSNSGLVKGLASEITRATNAEEAEVLRASNAESALEAAKVDRTELPQTITNVEVEKSGKNTALKMTRYNATNKQTSNFSKVLPLAAADGSQAGLVKSSETQLANEISVDTNGQMSLIGYSGLVSSIGGKANVSHTHTKTQVGLGNVDNTSDASKPISTAQQTALDGKSNTSHTHTKAQVGLGSVDNTSDANKPISTAQQVEFTKILAASGTTAGTSSALTLVSSGYTLTDGKTVKIKLHTSLGPDATLNVNSTGARAMLTAEGSAFPKGAVTGVWLLLTYSSTLGGYVAHAGGGGGGGFVAQAEPPTDTEVMWIDVSIGNGVLKYYIDGTWRPTSAVYTEYDH